MTEAIIRIIVGCSIFLFGFKILSENMEKLAGNGLKKLFNKTADKKFAGVGMGAAVTALVQSSAVTTVMVVGFVNAGIMQLNQAAAIIMGANIGTTITTQIVALGALDVKLYLMLLAFVGYVLMVASKKSKGKLLGLVLAGAGTVFVGLTMMSEGVKVFSGSESIQNLLHSIDNPILLLLIGIVVTALVQSSTAVNSIIITMASAGMMIGTGGNSVLYVILGTNIGTCVTALLSSMGTSTNAKRASVLHLLFNVLSTVIFMVVLLIWKDFNQMTFAKWFSRTETQIAMFHTFFNLVGTLIFLPFTKLLVKMATALVPEKEQEDSQKTYMDKRFVSNPSLAISQLKKEAFRMADFAMQSVDIALTGFIQKDTERIEEVYELNGKVLQIGGSISDYLVQVSAVGGSLEEERQISALHNDVGDISRIAELADNITKYTKTEVDSDLTFSPVVFEKIGAMHELLKKQYDVVKRTVLGKRKELIAESDAIEDKVDAMRKDLIADHIARMERGECRPENNTVFINLVSNLERMGDHLNYIAHSREQQ